MTQPQTPPAEAGFFATIRGWGITRSDARVFSGVAGGIAERLNWSRAWTRVGLVVLAVFLNGVVLLAYAAAWALLPDRQGRIVVQDFGRGVPNVGALVGIGIIAILGLIGLGDTGGPFRFDTANWPWNAVDSGPAHGLLTAFAVMLAVVVPLAVIGGVIFFIVMMARRNRERGEQPPGTPPVYAVPPAWAADRRAQRDAYRAARHEQRAQERASAAAYAATAVDEAVTAANAAAEQAAATASTAYAASSYGTPPPAYAPAAAQPAPASSPAHHGTPYAARPPRAPRVPGPGAPFYLLTLAWLVISGAGIVWADWQELLAVHPVIAWGPLFLTGLGVILVLVAATGRRMGFLAFLSAVGLIPAAILIANADDFRDGWADQYLPEIQVDGFGSGPQEATGDAVTEVEPDPIDTFDALSAFDGDYATISLPSGCYATEDVPSSAGESRGLVSIDPKDPGAETLTAAFTTVRMAADTSFTLTTKGGASATVYWPDREVACDLWDGTGVSLSNPGATDAALTADPFDGYATIIIEESEEVAR
ncbi:PspC domain-containing protein [Demequina phytophila]|uniref:PspC domain-containing protein n=1 Tax=Demequina phytophila TaxID=1638981 RepID=UPI000782EB22|nr:PspC domain-containing protein [Demequina phytophila]